MCALLSAQLYVGPLPPEASAVNPLPLFAFFTGSAAAAKDRCFPSYLVASQSVRVLYSRLLFIHRCTVFPVSAPLCVAISREKNLTGYAECLRMPSRQFTVDATKASNEYRGVLFSSLHSA